MPANSQVLIRAILLFIALAMLCNGASFWLKKVGFIQGNYLSTLEDEKSNLQLKVQELLNSGITVHDEKIIELVERLNNQKKRLTAFLYATPDTQIYLKSLKYIAITALVILCLLTRIKYADNQITNFSALLLFCAVIISTLANMGTVNWQNLFAGTYAFTFLIIAIIGERSISQDDLRFFAKTLLATILLLFLMAPIEINHGVQLFQNSSIIHKRITGFMLQPSSLGVYTVCISAFMLANFRHIFNNKVLIGFLILTSLLIISTGSLTAILALALLVYIELRNRFHQSTPNFPLKIMLPMLILTFLALYFSGRFNVDSIVGRFLKLQWYYAHDLTFSEMVFGHGIGVGTNTVIQVLSIFPGEHSLTRQFNISSDSTFLLLLIQTGIVGCALFYFLLFKAITIKHSIYRPTYFLIIFCSLTVNIIEVFPINVLLGLLLAQDFKNTLESTMPDRVFRIYNN